MKAITIFDALARLDGDVDIDLIALLSNICGMTDLPRYRQPITSLLLSSMCQVMSTRPGTTIFVMDRACYSRMACEPALMDYFEPRTKLSACKKGFVGVLRGTPVLSDTFVNPKATPLPKFSIFCARISESGVTDSVGALIC